MNAIDRIAYSFGYTHTSEAIRVTRKDIYTEKHGDRPNIRDIMVILTDGLTNVRTRQTLQEIRRLRLAGIHVLPIGIAASIDKELDAMATDGGAVFAASFHDLITVRQRILDFILEGMILNLCISYNMMTTCVS